MTMTSTSSIVDAEITRERFALVHGYELTYAQTFAREDRGSYEDIDFVDTAEWWTIRSDPYTTVDGYVQFSAMSHRNGRMAHFSLEKEAAYAVKGGTQNASS